MERVVLVAAVVLLIGCGTRGGASVTPEPEDPSGSWQLVDGTLDGGPIPVLDDYPVTLIIAGSEISGTAACNAYGGRLSAAGGRLQIGEIGMTAMGCEDPVQELEAAFVAALRRLEGIRRAGDTLTITGRDTEMTFTRLAPPPTGELIGTTWALESIVSGEVVAPADGAPATLILRDDGTLSGSTGCRTFRGRWIERGNEILATELGMNEIDCPLALADQDSHVVSVIGDGFIPMVQDGRLTLTDPGGAGLVYRAEE